MIVYHALLWLYPKSFRDEYGGEMRASLARRWRRARGFDRALLLAGALLDTLRNAPAAHLDILGQDLRAACQTLRRAPGFSVTVVAVTAVGIGATTAAFAVADHVLVRPLPYWEPDRLVKIWQAPPGGLPTEAAPANFRDWRDNARSFEQMAGFEPDARNLVGSGEPVRLEGASVTGQLFSTLGVAPLLGRTITVDDDRGASAPTVVISERLWRSRFAGDADTIGRTISLDDKPHLVIGVMPAAFEFPSRLADFWVPMQLQPAHYVYGNAFIHTVARLHRDVTLAQAHAEIQGIARAVSRANPDANPRVSAMVIAMRDEVSEQARLLLVILVAASAGLLLIACTNLANLLLTRGVGRQKEFALRAALGGARHRLTRQLFTENALLAVAGGVLGVGIAVAGIPSLVRLVPTTLPAAELPPLDIRILAAAIVATFVSAVGFGYIPAWRLSRQSGVRALHDGARSGTSRQTARLRSALVVIQVSASVLLLVASGLLLRAMVRVQGTDPGFRTEGVLTLQTALPMQRYDTVRLRHQFFERVLTDVEALPGVRSAAYTTGLPMVERGRIWVIRVPGYEDVPKEDRVASLRFITPRLFETLGIPLLDGRDLSDADTQTSLPVAVVSESFAKRFWPNTSAVGRQFTVRAIEWTIVGVVADVRVRGLEHGSEPQAYFSEQQMNDRGLSEYVPRALVVKSDAPVERLVPEIRAIIAAADSQQPISDVQLVADIVNAETAPRRVQVRVLGAFALIAFVLAGIGLHGLLAYNVSQGARDIGVRLALGAERQAILLMVLTRGLRLAAGGVVIGGVLALGAGRALQALLAGISPTDVASFVGAVLLALAMTTLGSLLPAWKASRVDPLQVMRAE
jgi:predicted permease